MLKIPRSEYKQMAWKNGLGVTAEIDRVPGADGSYLWRLSQASIPSDGPFSTFPGYDRWLAVWRGDSIFLNDRKVSALEPIRFSGDDSLSCRLTAGAVEDVGFIFDRTKVDAKMTVVEGIVSLPTGVHYLFDIQRGDTVKVERPTEMSVARSLLVSAWSLG